MKLGVEPERSHYRNPTVYRSAERLLASRPRRRFAPPRWLVFAVGVAAGAVAVALVVWFGTRPAPKIADATGGIGRSSASSSTAAASQRPTQPITFATVPRPAASEQGAAKVITPRSLPRTPTFSTGETQRLPRPGRDSAAITNGRTLASRPEGPPTTLATLYSSKVSTWMLRGELLEKGSQAAPVTFHLDIFQSGPMSWVSGAVKFSVENSDPQPYVWLLAFLEGNILEGRAGDFEFSLDLPDWTKEQLVVGTWSRGNKHGTLDLRRTFTLPR